MSRTKRQFKGTPDQPASFNRSSKTVEPPEHEEGQPHELALLFPPLGGDAFRKLTEDVRENGLLQDIVLFEDKILDGVHRDKACIAAQVPRRYRQFKGTYDGALSFVLSMNKHRRHMGVEQLSALAVKVERLQTERGKKTETKQLAEQIGISTKAAQQAKKVVHHGSKALIEATEDKEIPLNQAANLVDLPVASQHRIVAGDKRIPLTRRVHIEQTQRIRRGENIRPESGPPKKHSGPLSKPRHEAFARAISEGKSGLAAYRKAGYSNATDAAAMSSASRLVKRPEIAARIAELGTESIQTYEQNRVFGYLIGEGAGGIPLSDLTIREIGGLIVSLTCDLIILRRITGNSANPDPSAKVRDVIDHRTLADIIQRAKSESRIQS